MALVDPIADMLSRIRNAQMALHSSVSIPKSNVKKAIAEILKDEGYIVGYSEGDRSIDISLKYYEGKPVIEGLRRISKPGRRNYVGAKKIPLVQGGLGICIMSTSKGILEGGKARQENAGGEVLCEVW